MGLQVAFFCDLAHVVVAELFEGLRKCSHRADVPHFLILEVFMGMEGPVRPSTEDLLFVGVFIEDVVEGIKVSPAVGVEPAHQDALTVRIVDDFEQNGSLS